MKFHFNAALYFSLPQAYYSAIVGSSNSISNTLSTNGRALVEAKLDLLDPSTKRCLVDDSVDPDLCRDSVIFSSNVVDEVVISEASMEVESPATLEADNLGSDMGEPQVVDLYNQDNVLSTIHEARVYMQEIVLVDDKYAKVRDICKNENTQCAFWASIGECDKNPGYMKVNCGPVCKSCEMKHVQTRCPLDPNAKDALEPGDLNAMFERIVTDPYFKQYEPIVISRPDYAPGDTAETADYKIGLWMVMFENALSDKEADRMIELGGLQGYARSADVGHEKEDGTFDAQINQGRTSTNAWCTDECYKDPTARTLMDRIANITGIPEPNSENLQLLQYQENEFYQTHNDYIGYQLDRPCGVRILTFYMYLNNVPEGGGTNFPRVGATVTPKKGRAVLWPSVFDETPNLKDSRSDHQALPVIQGVKYGANAWIHQRDFKTANLMGCS